MTFLSEFLSAKKRAKEKIKNAPQPLSRARNRTLSTLPIQTVQPTPCFLTHLPPEIRQEVYAWVLGGGLVHIVRKGKHLAHVRCKLNGPSDFTRSCRPAAAATCHEEIPILASTANGNIALLMTCKQIYREAIQIMYSTNTFDFDHQDLFLFFARSILPHRLAQIRSMDLFFSTFHLKLPFAYTGSTKSAWVLTWQMVARDMPALRHLRLRIFGEQGASYPSMDRQWWLEDILQVRGLRSFDLEYRAPSNVWVEFGDGVFEMERLMKEHIRGAVCSDRNEDR
ncbi:MAG: hypothetical protein Q9220_001667 [cf. Caloplaca sp. 1 TL-2023]